MLLNAVQVFSGTRLLVRRFGACILQHGCGRAVAVGSSSAPGATLHHAELPPTPSSQAGPGIGLSFTNLERIDPEPCNCQAFAGFRLRGALLWRRRSQQQAPSGQWTAFRSSFGIRMLFGCWCFRMAWMELRWILCRILTDSTSPGMSGLLWR